MSKSYPSLARRGFLLPKRMQANYDGAGNGRRSISWKATDAGPATTPLGSLRTLRRRSRAAVRNDPWAFSALDRLTSNTVGTGITPKQRYGEEEERREISELWEDWTDEADADERTDFYGLQALIAQTVAESGECFVRLRHRRPEDGLCVPLQLQALEPDYVPHEHNATLPHGHEIRAGIEFNGFGKRIAYHMYRHHPGDGARSTYNQLIRVPAEQVLHVYDLSRPGQLRGVPVLSTVLARLKSLDDFDDAVLFRQEVANLFAGFIRKPIPEEEHDYSGAQVKTDDDGFTPIVAMEPGTMQELGPGEEVEFSDPPDAGNNYEGFVRQQLLAAAAGTGVPYEILTGDLSKANDRVIRVVLNEFHRRLERIQFGVYVYQLCRPVRAAWMDTAILCGALDLPNYGRDRRKWLRTRWVPQGWAYTHPVQDVAAAKMRIAIGLGSRSEECLKQGYDAEIIDKENADDAERAARLGLVYDLHPRQTINRSNDDTREDSGLRR